MKFSLRLGAPGLQAPVAQALLPAGSRLFSTPVFALRHAPARVMVGRTPCSARVPLDPLFSRRISLIQTEPADEGVSCGPGGPKPSRIEKTKWHWTESLRHGYFDRLCNTVFLGAALCLAASLALSGCGLKVQADAKAEAPPAAEVERDADANLVKVDHPERYPLATAAQHASAPELNVTGAVNPDVSRNIPVISLASGRVVEIHARIGDAVTKGMLLMRVQSADISQAFSDYRSAVADEVLARAQFERSKLLYEKGAVAQKDLEVAQDADAKAKITVENATERIRVLGADINRPSSIIDIHAPVSGVVIEQNVTASAGVKTLDNSPNLFTIADLSQVWVICDVYENDLPFVHLNEYADIHLNAYPNMLLKGRVSNIGPSLDPNIRTAKVRLEVSNPGALRLGMFVTATFHGLNKEMHATVPANAILHLHDRDWVYVPAPGGKFRRVEVVGGKMLPGNLQEILSGLKPGQQVVANALVLENTVEQ